MGEKIIARTKNGEITIDQLAEIQPGMARLMDELSRRFTYLYYSAKGGNWQMAKHQYNELVALIKILTTVRPKYAQDMEEYQKQYLPPVLDSIGRKDWSSFETSCDKAIEGSDLYHNKYGYSYIRYVVPSKPPEHFYLGPPEKFSRKKSSASD